MLRRIFLFLFLGIIIGCGARSKSYSEPLGPCFQKKGLPLCLLVAHKNGLTTLEYDPQSKKYQKKAAISSSELTSSPERFSPINIAVVPNYIFLAATIGEHHHQGNGLIFRFNSSLKEKISREFKNPITAMSQDSQNLFAGFAPQGYDKKLRFLSLNQQLNELDSIEVETTTPTKAIDSIIAYQDFAYLLDNVTSPIYLLKIKIKDPKDMKITKRISFAVSLPSDELQWLNPRYDQWLVVCCAGPHRTVRIYPMKDGTNLRKQETIYSYDPEKDKKEGTMILAVTSLPPIWAVVWQAGKEKCQLAQIKTKSDQIKFLYSLELDKGNTGYRYIIKRKGDYLFISWQHTITIIDIEKEPKVFLPPQDLKEFGIEWIADILPY